VVELPGVPQLEAAAEVAGRVLPASHLDHPDPPGVLFAPFQQGQRDADAVQAAGGGRGAGHPDKVTVTVTLKHPQAAGVLDQAPVTVSITTATARNALVVPVNALLARPAGYAVEEVSPGGRHHLVPVRLGLFDDAAGLVQVTGPGLAAGQRIVVPAS
jgi:hypothetical protein